MQMQKIKKSEKTKYTNFDLKIDEDLAKNLGFIHENHYSRCSCTSKKQKWFEVRKPRT